MSVRPMVSIVYWEGVLGAPGYGEQTERGEPTTTVGDPSLNWIKTSKHWKKKLKKNQSSSIWVSPIYECAGKVGCSMRCLRLVAILKLLLNIVQYKVSRVGQCTWRLPSLLELSLGFIEIFQIQCPQPWLFWLHYHVINPGGLGCSVRSSSGIDNNSINIISQVRLPHTRRPCTSRTSSSRWGRSIRRNRFRGWYGIMKPIKMVD